ncbi:hypothetical protein CLD22_10920 [Rubrivivax gelatinosus]|nr:hypothetical protein [Rubrivivax gelatinosus]
MPLPRRLVSGRWLLAAGAALAGAAMAQQQGGRSTDGIYSCVDDSGRRITSDRPIPECLAREQRVLNRDGSLRKVVPPTPTADERAEIEARERRAVEARAAQADAVRRDRNLIARYPNEEAHRRAREAALDTVRVAIRSSEQRLKMLAAERKPLTDETEFYVGKPLPPKLHQALDANDAATDAQRTAMANQEAELVRINRLYDAELDRLRRLWAGARPGSLGPIATLPEPASAASR